MTITAVHTKISTALRDLRLTDTEAKHILEAAKPTLSNGEVKAIGDLYSRVTTRPHAPPGAVICFPTTADSGALNRLNTFISAKSLPIGKNAAKTADAINKQLMLVRLAPGQTARPANLSKLIPIELDDVANRPLGSGSRVAWVDIVKKTYVLETRGPVTQHQTSTFHVGLALPALKKDPRDV